MAGTYVYIDGLNFYYGAVKKTPHKWIDFEALSRVLVPRDTITLIRYFTAQVKPRYPGDRSHERHSALLRAIKANPLIETTLGHFRVDPVWLPIEENPPKKMMPTPPPHELFRPTFRPATIFRWIWRDASRRRRKAATMAYVRKPEEKGSDVNLGTYLLYDAMSGNSTKAVVITNDSDLAEPIRLTVAQGVPVGLVNPHHKNPTNRKLLDAASFEIPFHKGTPARCQLPNPVIGARGKQIHKPVEW